jgi:D-alanine transaminase
MVAYFNGQFLPKERIAVSPDDRAFLFADGVYEVIRSYQGRPFLLEDHFGRLKRSLQEVRIAAPDLKDVREAVARLILENRLAGGDALIYIQITRGTAPRKHVFPDPPVLPTVYITATPYEPDKKALNEGVGVLLAPDIRWSRCDIKTVSLLPNVLACQQAREKGAYESVFVRDGMVTEGTHTNVCAVFNGWLVTHPEDHSILSGITRKRVLYLCLETGISFEEAPIPSHQLSMASEIMLLGTMTEIMPVVRVDDWTVGNGKPGPVCIKLQEAFRSLTAAESR